VGDGEGVPETTTHGAVYTPNPGRSSHAREPDHLGCARRQLEAISRALHSRNSRFASTRPNFSVGIGTPIQGRMGNLRDTDERRSKRHARGLVCEVWIDGTRYTGTVKDVSSGGLFIHTRASALPGTAITLVFAPAPGLPEFRFTARVVRSEQIRPHPQSVQGIGVEVLQPGALERVIGDLGRIERAGDTVDHSKKRTSR
jgi:hypothetical protein